MASSDTRPRQQADAASLGVPAPPSALPPPAPVAPSAGSSLGQLPESLEEYVRKEDGSHLRLGLTVEGMVAFLIKIGFAEGNTDGWLCINANTKPGYVRRSKLSWLNAQVGHVEVDGFVRNMTGYDLADYIRQWILCEGHGSLSIAEVILLDARFQELRPHVAVANVFLSHLQLESFFLSSTDSDVTATLDILEEAYGAKCSKPPIPGILFLWVDYFCLRQGCQDFQPARIVELIGQIGTLAACLDKKGQYLKRSFCVLEAYAAVKTGATIIIPTIRSFKDLGLPTKETMREMLAPESPPDAVDGKFVRDFGNGMWEYSWMGPVDTARATTRDPQDKALIDAYIASLQGGFQTMDGAIMKALIRLASGKEGKSSGGCCSCM